MIVSMKQKLRACAAAAAAALALGACGLGSPDAVTYRDAENRSLFELPDEWNLYTANELIRITPVPFLPDIGGYLPISFVAFDGAAGRSIDNLTIDATISPYPVGAHIIRQISPEEKELLSRRVMTLSAYDMTQGGQGVQIDTWDFTFGRDYSGIGAQLRLTSEDGQRQGLVYVLAVTNPDGTELYSMAAGCSRDCFTRQSRQIVDAVNSWAVNTRR